MRKILKKEKGVTLVALSVTIIILIILAGITIRALFGQNGLIEKAKRARDDTAESTQKEKDSRNKLLQEYEDTILDIDSDSDSYTIKKAKDNNYVFTSKTPVKDEKNNTIMVPAGFKIASDSGDTVQQGIVIEDVSASSDTNVQGSQYVWIPVGTFTKDDGSTSGQIKLGRYTFDESTGTPTLKQDAVNYTQSVVIESYYSELSTYREGVASDGTDGLNATAKDLKGFIDSVASNGGYYIGRYEASYASGSSTENYKAASKISNGYNDYSEGSMSMSYTPRTLWNYITQIDASKVAINTYAGSTSVKSDLINSYAWDTAIVYIQEAGNSNYANQTSKNYSLANTGANADEVCKINDMASNVIELTTEYSSSTLSFNAGPCTHRGGLCSRSDFYPANRGNSIAADSYDYIGFRLSLYL